MRRRRLRAPVRADRACSIHPKITRPPTPRCGRTLGDGMRHALNSALLVDHRDWISRVRSRTPPRPRHASRSWLTGRAATPAASTLPARVVTHVMLGHL